MTKYAIIQEREKEIEKRCYMTKGRTILLLILVIVFGCAIFVGNKVIGFYKEYNNQVSVDGENVEIHIEQGTSVSGIAHLLKEKGLIQYERAFTMKAGKLGYASELKYGTFMLHKGMSIDDILKTLANSENNQELVKVVIPEGYTVQMIAKRLEEKGVCSADDFLKAANTLDYDFEFLKGMTIPDGVDYALQGFLFPATYEWKKGTSAETVVKRMLKAFADNVSEEELAKAKTLDKSIYEIITIASIVEREAKLDEERPTIAGVIYNRLDINMKLQMCPTVLYPLTKGMYNVNRVLYKDLTIDSPYNTYKNYGLPIGPIANPGLASIHAALNPEHHEYLFYHTDGTSDGKHIFTKTYEEHEDTRIIKE